MSGKRHQIDLELAEIDFHLAGGLCGIDVEKDATAATEFSDCRDVLDHADLVVHVHHGNQGGVGADRALEFFQIDQPVGAHPQVSHLVAFALQFTTGVQNGLVLGPHRDQVFSLAVVKVGRTLDGEVVGLGGAGSPNDFPGIGVHQCRDLATRLLHRMIGIPTEHVGARSRVAEEFAEVGNHLRGHARVHRGGGRVVKVNGGFNHVDTLREPYVA